MYGRGKPIYKDLRMRLGHVTTLLGTLSLLCLAGCAGTPPTGEQASAVHHDKCETFTGSRLCGDSNDQSMGNPNAPNANGPGVNGTIGAAAGGHR